MSTADARTILTHLTAVQAERATRAADASLAVRVQAVKAYQQRRFELTYADLLAHPRYARASRFFLDELYGPADFTRRDAQFARVVPAMTRLFPGDVVSTVVALAALHALSERFDTAMARRLGDTELTAAAYAQAWRDCNDAPGRERQIQLMLCIGHGLDTFTRNPWLRHSLRLMRGPARAAGLDSLQTFLEAGFDTFRAMRGAEDFLTTIATRERKLADQLATGWTCEASLLGQLP